VIRAVTLFRSGGRVPKAVDLASKLKTLECVTDAYAVFGRFDIVAFFECKDQSALFRSVSEVTKLPGIMSTETFMEILANEGLHEYGRGPFSG
jgi:uncharacterized protein with GYD domain